MKIQVMNGGKAPKQPAKGDVGYDCYANADWTRLGSLPVRIPLGFAVEPTPGHFCKIESRSGLASTGIVVFGGIIDPNYRGELEVIVMAVAEQGRIIQRGDRICQLVQYAYNADGYELVDALDQTQRGGMGFGSTGV